MKIRTVLKSVWREFLAATAGRTAMTTADTLLRQVLAAGFWSRDGVCHYCGKFDAECKTHEEGCTAKALLAWAAAHGVELRDVDNVFPAAELNGPQTVTPAEFQQRLDDFVSAMAQRQASPQPPATIEEAKILLEGIRESYRNHHPCQSIRGDDPVGPEPRSST